MLELYLIIKNTSRNATLAETNGRIGIIAKIYTVIFWLTFYFWGFIFGAVLFLEILDVKIDQTSFLGLWLIAFLFSQLGFLVSRIIAGRAGKKHSPP